MNLLQSWSRQQAEDFLFEEAALLDEWRLDEWRALFTAECRYLVPGLSIDADAEPDSSLYLIADDGYHLSERINRLKKKTAFAEQPRSKTLRLISNVILRDWHEGQRGLRCAFITYRSTPESTDTFWGHHHYRMTQTPEGVKIAEKRTVLTMATLRPQGKLTIIL